MNYLKLSLCLCYVLTVASQDAESANRKLCPPMANVGQPPNRADTSQRIESLRKEMTKVNSIQGPPIDAYLVTRYDSHQNEFVSNRDKRLEYITGYTGGFGLAVITRNNLGFWTDELHFTQANNELHCNWNLMKIDSSTSIQPAEWLIKNLQPGNRVGTDPKLIPNTEWENITKSLSGSSGVILLPINNNLIDVIWTTDRENYTFSNAYIWPEEYSGKSWTDKLNDVRNSLKELECDALIITSLGEIAWLLNIRGNDLPFSPVLRAYVIVSKDQLHLYTDQNKLTDEVKTHLRTLSCVSSFCVRVHDYDNIWNDFRTIPSSWRRILLPSMSYFSPGASRFIVSSVSTDKRRAMPSPIIPLMAVKNAVERQGMKEAHVRDAVAFCNFMAHVEIEMERSGDAWDEDKLSKTLDQYRSNQNFSRGISYPTMVSFGPNSGVPQYIPNNDTNNNLLVDREKLLIIDGGGHYWDGTTSLARTFHFSNATEEEIKIYTHILMGIIDMAMTSFPPTMKMSQLDIISRVPLWKMGMDYPHGTGQGIGVFSDVHQSPIFLNYKSKQDDFLKDGYFFVNEMGYYREDQFGIKLSNVLEVNFKNDSLSGFFSFEPVSLVPFEPKLINYTFLSVQQKIWLNDYNKKIENSVGEILRSNQNTGWNWLVDRIKEIPLKDVENSSILPGSCIFLLIVSCVITFIFG